MAHELSKLRREHPLWRVWECDGGHLYATRSGLFQPGQGHTVDCAARSGPPRTTLRAMPLCRRGCGRNAVSEPSVDERDGAAGMAELERLAAELHARDHRAHLVTPAGKRPYLHTANPGVLSENVAYEAGWYWWAERLAPATDVPAAADKITRVLRGVDGPQ